MFACAVAESKCSAKKRRTDKEVTLTLPANQRKLLKKYNTKDDIIRCRLAVVELSDGNKKVLCTSVSDKGVLPYESFAGLYHFRWYIEGGV